MNGEKMIPIFSRVSSRLSVSPSLRLFAYYLIPVFCLLLFFALGAYQLHLPGLHYDEAKEAGLNAMQLLTGQPVTAFRDATVSIGPWRVPLMVQDYIGALNVFLAVPFLALGGIHPVALRWLPLLTGGLTLLLTWRVTRRLGGPMAAHSAALLLAVHPSFVFWSRQGIFVTNITAFCLMAGLFFGLRWWNGRRPPDLWLTAFFWGMGLYAKLLFLWAVGATALTALVAWVLRQRTPPAHLPTLPVPVVWGVAVLCFLLPLTPLILFNLRTGGTFASVLGNLNRSYYGVNNQAILPNLLIRLSQLRTLLRGDHFWYLGGIFADGLAPYLAGGLVLMALILAPGEQRRALIFSLGLLAMMVVQSIFTVSDLFVTHYALLLPLIPLTEGLAVAALMRGRSPGIARAVLTFLLLWAGADLQTTIRYHRALARTGGHSAHSSAIYDLAAYLNRNSTGPLLVLDWGISAPVEFLTAGNVRPQEVFGYESLAEPDSNFIARVKPFLDNPDTLYLAHTPEDTVFRGRVETLQGLATEYGLHLQEEHMVAEKSGRPLFVIYRAVPAVASGPLEVGYCEKNAGRLSRSEP